MKKLKVEVKLVVVVVTWHDSYSLLQMDCLDYFCCRLSHSSYSTSLTAGSQWLKVKKLKVEVKLVVVVVTWYDSYSLFQMVCLDYLYWSFSYFSYSTSLTARSQ